MAATSMDILITNIMGKLDNMPLSFDPDQTNIESTITGAINDTLRELNLTINGIESGSKLELFIELRSVWWTLFRYKNSSAVFFKYGTGTNDGKTVDKTMITKAISSIMDDIEEQYQQYKPAVGDSTGKLWNMIRRESGSLR